MKSEDGTVYVDQKDYTSVIMGTSFLQPTDEKGHFGLFRNVFLRDLRDGKETAGAPIGPLFVFRIAAKDELEDMWTLDETTGNRLGLVKVWDGRNPDGQIKPRKKR